MKPTPILAAVSLVVTAVFTSAALAADAPADADQLLRQMSAKLASAKSFSFEATREIAPGLIEGLDVPEKARIAVAVQRPNKIAAQAASKSGPRRFVFDGRAATLLDEKKNLYASLPMRTTIDGLVDVLDEKYGFVPPLADFAVSNPYAEFRRQARSITYLGRGKTGGFLGMGGVECHRLALNGRAADAELWIGVADQLPRKLVATFHRAGNPQLRIAFNAWNLAATTPATDFTFTPPKGSQKIEMWTTAKMQAAR